MIHGHLNYTGISTTLTDVTMIGGAARANHRRVGRARRTIAGLTFGVGHGCLTDRLARHGSTPNRYVTKPLGLRGWFRRGS